MEQTTLKERDQKVAELAAQGSLNQRDIARRVGLHYNTVGNILKQPAVQAYVAQLVAEAAEPLPEVQDAHTGANQAAIDAIKALWSMVRHSKNERLRFEAAIELLDRAGPDVAPKRQLHGQPLLSTVRAEYLMAESQRHHNQVLLQKGIIPKIRVPDQAQYLAMYFDRESNQYLGERWVDETGSPVQ